MSFAPSGASASSSCAAIRSVLLVGFPVRRRVVFQVERHARRDQLGVGRLQRQELLRIGEERQQRDDRPGVDLAAVGRQLAHRFRHRLERRLTRVRDERQRVAEHLRRRIRRPSRTPCAPPSLRTATGCWWRGRCRRARWRSRRACLRRPSPRRGPRRSWPANTSCAARLLRRSLSTNFSSSNFAG